MYPFHRTLVELFEARAKPPLGLSGSHETLVTVLPWDIDVFRELNNGRTLTLLDIGRFGYFVRLGFLQKMKARRWGGTVAGVSVRYRRRVRMFDRVTLVTTGLGRDERFFYLDQSLWRNGTATGNVLLRLAITGGDGIVPTDEVLAALGVADWNPPLPDWAAAWAEAEATRPWPPEPHPTTSVR